MNSYISIPSRVLIAEDDPDLLALLSLTLRGAGFEVAMARSGEAALRAFERNRIGLALLDINMPEMDGFAVCEAIRASSFIPVMMLSACDQEVDQLRALDVGADAYVIKPFSPLALVARVRALLRRTPASRTPLLRYGELSLDIEGHVLLHRARELALTRLETRVLHLLLTHPGQVVTARRLIDEVWNHQDAANRNMLKQAVFRLRRKLNGFLGANHPLLSAEGGYSWSNTPAREAVDESNLLIVPSN